MTTTETTYRRATDDEIVADKLFWIERGRKVPFRHFVVESGDRRTRTGVRHRNMSSARLQVIDGAPFVQHHGKLQRLTASLMTMPSGRAIVVDLRIASAYLPSGFEVEAA